MCLRSPHASAQSASAYARAVAPLALRSWATCRRARRHCNIASRYRSVVARGGTCARGRTWCLQLTMALPSAWGCQAPRRPPSLKSKRARKSIVLRVSPKLSLLHSALLLFRAPQSLPVFTSVPHHVLCGLGFTAATNHGHASTCDGSTYVLCYFALCHYCVRYLCSHAATFVSHGCVRAQLQLAIHSE